MSTKTLDRKTAKVGRAYEADLYGWVEDQVALLKANEVGSIDASHITLELEDSGRSEFNRLVSATRVVLHLLEWDHQPGRRSRSWVITVRTHRRRIRRELRDSPSLKPKVEEAIGEAYPDALDGARRETGLSPQLFPQTCPYTWQEIVERRIAFMDDISSGDDD
jgi:Domain of unknown function DUF29